MLNSEVETFQYLIHQFSTWHAGSVQLGRACVQFFVQPGHFTQSYQLDIVIPRLEEVSLSGVPCKILGVAHFSIIVQEIVHLAQLLPLPGCVKVLGGRCRRVVRTAQLGVDAARIHRVVTEGVAENNLATGFHSKETLVVRRIVGSGNTVSIYIVSVNTF